MSKLRSWGERSEVLHARRRKGPHLFQKRQATRLNGLPTRRETRQRQ